MSNNTPEQQAFIDKVATTQESIRLDAVAGSGKTTTLLKASHKLATSLSITALAFNKNIADELQKKFPAHVQCKTLNSVGNGVWLRFAGRMKLDPKKMSELTSEWCRDNLSKDDADLLWLPIKTVVTAIKSAGLVPPQWLGKTQYYAPEFDQSEVEEILAANDFNKINPELVNVAAQQIMMNSIAAAGRSKIDFDDQIYMSTYFAPQDFWPRNDVVMVDEAQDLSRMQHDMIERMGATSRLIVAGDPNQAIYGWRGASTKSLDELEARFNLVRMPLTLSFRCPAAIVEVAQSIVPHIQAAKAGGTVEDWDAPAEGGPASSETEWFVEDFELGSVVLCRNNAPLIKLGFGMIRAGISCYFTGKDIAAGLKKIVQELPESTDLVYTLRNWYETERAKLEAKQAYTLLDRHDDRFEALHAILMGCGAVTRAALISGIDNLFRREPSANAIELSTIHRAKGKEWETVYFLNEYLIPGRWIVDMVDNEVPNAEDLLQQEHNLKYVAVTRSLNKLVYVTLTRDDEVKSRKAIV